MATTQGRNVSSPITVGRESELATLGLTLGRLVEGEANIVVVSGEAGIGKTRLVAQATADAGDSIRVMRGDCLALGTTIPYLPFAEMLRGLIRGMPNHEITKLIGPARRELARFMPELAIPGDGSADPRAEPRLSGDMERLRLYEALLRVAERIATDRPTVYVVEDIQWIDPASLELLAFLIHALDSEGRAMLIATVRTEALGNGSPVLSFLADLDRRATVERIELRPLGADETRRQLTAIIGGRPSDAVVERIQGLADGNPLFAEELLAASDLDAPADDSLPPKLRDVLAARLTRLDGESMAVLRVAAAAGRTLDERLLIDATGLREKAVDRALRIAIDEHILTRSQGSRRGSYGFRHEIMRGVVAAQLLPVEAARIHAAYAKALGSLPTERQNASEIAFHWDGSGDVDAALPARIRAGLEAADAHAYEQAREHFERALALWDDATDAARLAGHSRPWVLERAASVSARAGHYERAIELTREVIAAGAGDDPELYEWARSSLRWYLWEAGRSEAARDEARIVVDDASVDGRWRANALGHLGGLLAAEQRIDEAETLADEALALARSVGAQEEAILAQGVLGWCRLLGGDVDAGLAAIRGTVDAASALDDGDGERRYPVGPALASAQLTAALELVGHFEEALAVADDGIGIAARYGIDRTYGSLMQAHACRSLYRLGRWDEAAARIEAAVAAGSVGSGRIALLTVRALLAIGRGDDATAATAIEDTASLSDDRTPVDVRRWTVAASAELALWGGRPTEALFQLAVLGDTAVGPTVWRPGALPSRLDASVPRLIALAARAAADLALEERARGGDTPMSDAAADQVRASLKRISRHKALADAWSAELLVVRAELERLTKGTSASPRRWQAAADATTERPYLGAYARWRLAEVHLSRRNGRGDAAPVIEEGLKLAETLGARSLIERLEDLAQRARLSTRDEEGATSVAPAGSGRPFGLTTREVEVLVLLADGMSNQEIADHLFISPKTASVHVSNIYGKLGVESRVAAATTAASLGLTSAQGDGARE